MESRLLQLPEDIFHRIMYNDHLLSDPAITNRAAIRLSLVSKEFLTAVQRRPVLVFGDQIYHSQERKYIISTLTRYRNENIHLDTFIFSCLCPEQIIELAAAKNLGLKNLNIRMQYTYVLPKPVFKAESLVQLKLRNCNLQPGESIITWPNLKRLSLCLVGMEEGAFENIIRGCPLIEFLEINHCRSYNCNSNFKVSNLGFLKKLDIVLGGDQTFELGAAPNLECLNGNGTCLQVVQVGKYEYHKLKSIMLSNVGVNGDFLINSGHQFPVLEALTLTYINLQKINISSPSLKTIQMEGIRGLQEASFDVPNVVLFTFENDVAPKLSIAGNSDGWTSCITFRIGSDSIDTPWFLKLKELFAAINMPESSIHISFSDEFINLFIHQTRAQKSDVSFPVIIQHLTVLTTSSQLKASLAREILDGTLLFVSPLRMMIKDWYDCEFPKVLYDHLMFGNVNSTKRNVTRIEVNGNCTKLRMNGSWHRVLEQPQVSDRDKFMELFKDVVDDRDNKFTISFDLKY